MMNAIFVVLEVAVIALFLFLLYKWSHEEGAHTPANAKRIDELTEQDYMDLMLKTADQEVGQIHKTPLGLLQRKTVLDLQSVIIYYTTRTGMSALKRERIERRAHFADKNWKRYKKAIHDQQRVKEDRLVRFTLKLLKAIGVSHDVFAQSIQMVPHSLVLKNQEVAILRASQDWHEAQLEVHAEGILPTTEEKARMAEVEYQVKMAKL